MSVNINTINRIITRKGQARASDVLACARVLASAPNNKLGTVARPEKPHALFVDAGVTRTRDARVLATAIEDENTLVLDVGGVYDPAKGAIDPSDEGAPEPRENGIGYSSFGLVTRWLGLDDMEALCLHVDATDTGFRGEIPPPPAMISALINKVIKDPETKKSGVDFSGTPRTLDWLVHMCHPARVDGLHITDEEFDVKFETMVEWFQPFFGRNGEYLDSHPFLGEIAGCASSSMRRTILEGRWD